MKYKGMVYLLTIALLAAPNTLLAKEEIIQKREAMEQVEETKNEYLVKKGEITEVSQEGENYSILVGTPEEGIRFIIADTSFIVDEETLKLVKAKELKEGMKVTVILPKDAPVALSLPPVTGAQTAIIIDSKNYFMAESFFDAELVDETRTLALNIGVDTIITNIKGEKLTAEDVKEHCAIVIYTNSTRSIPAQTTPKWILVLPQSEGGEAISLNESEEPIQRMAKDVVIRQIAEAKEYEITWDNTTKTATLIKGDKVVSFTVGQKQCMINQEPQTLNSVVRLEEGQLIASHEILQYLE